MRYSEEQVWESYDGKKTKIKDLEDTHLANIINHMKKLGGYPNCFISFMEEVARKRGLKPEFLARSEIPHKDKDGNWRLWDQKLNYPVKVG